MKFFFNFQIDLSVWALPIAVGAERVNNHQKNRAIEIMLAILCFQFEFTFNWDPTKFRGFWKFARLIFAVLCVLVGIILLTINLSVGTPLIQVIFFKTISLGVFIAGLYLFKQYK